VSGRFLSVAEREDVAIWYPQKLGVREIARRLRRSPPTISRSCVATRPLGRGGSSTGRPRRSGTPSDGAPPRTAKMVTNERLRDYVQDRLASVIRRPDGTPVLGPDVPWKGRNKPHRQDRRWATSWSPEQVASRLPVDFPDDESMRISHEAIYQTLYVHSRGALKRELVASLRTGRALRVPRARARPMDT
jgi:transposase, IS30 family